MPPPDEVVRLRRPGDGDWLAAPWLELLDRTDVSSYCLTPDWALSWWETIGELDEALVAVWHGSDGRFDAVCGLSRHSERLHRRVPLRAAAWVNLGGGRGNGDHLGLTSTAERTPDVVAWLAAMGRRRSLHLHSLDPSSARPQASGWLEPAVTDRIRCPRVSLTDGDPVPSTFRRKVDAYRRRLDREGVELDVVAGAGISDELLGALFDLHEARWESVSGRRPGHLRARRAFFAQLIARGSADRGPRLVVARRDGEVLGALLGFRHRTTFSYFQSGWDPRVAHLSLGTALVDAAMEHAVDTGAHVFDFMRGTTAFKYRFGAVDVVDESVLVPSGPSGALLRWKYTAGRDVARRYAEPPPSAAREGGT